MSKIGVFDSGIGGLTILEKLKEVIPDEDYIFYADSANNPYGEKTDDELYAITSHIVDYLIKKDCHLIVIACNTATTRCISYLREKYPDIVFIGTEPAIKVACDNHYHHTLVMATPATVSSERTSVLVNTNIQDDEEIDLVPCYGLAHAIEVDDIKEQRKILSNIHQEYGDKEIDAIVLGCTHYPHIKALISEYFPTSELLDGSLGVAKETKRKLEEHHFDTHQGTTHVEIIQTK